MRMMSKIRNRTERMMAAISPDVNPVLDTEAPALAVITQT